jgi:hypothetical protein
MSLAFTGNGSPVTLTNKYEILMPIDVSRKTIDIAHQADNKTFNNGKKINSTISTDLILYTRLAIRIHRSLLASLETFLEGNYSNSFLIQATGYDLFDNNNKGSSENVRIISYNSEREQTNWYKINLRLVKV